MECLGRNLDEHCCWLNGKLCEFLEEDSEPKFRWSCGLRRELGSWDAVLNDHRYNEVVEPRWQERSKRLSRPMTNCRDYPSDKESCTHCGANC